MFKAFHAQERKEVACEKAIRIAKKLRAMKLTKATRKVADGIEKTLTYMDFPTQHWTRIRTNKATEQFNRESNVGQKQSALFLMVRVP